jgi:Na+/phosphate symporter
MSTIDELKTELQVAKVKRDAAEKALEDHMGDQTYLENLARTERAVDKINAQIALAVAQQKRDSLLAAQPRDVQAIAIAEKDVEAAQHHYDLLGKFS